MNYLCLRNCYVQDRLHYKGEVYELPDGFPIYEKNFKPVEGQEPEPTPPADEPVVDAPEKAREPKIGQYLCSKCNGIHKEISKLGQRHLKYKGV